MDQIFKLTFPQIKEISHIHLSAERYCLAVFFCVNIIVTRQEWFYSIWILAPLKQSRDRCKQQKLRKSNEG